MVSTSYSQVLYHWTPNQSPRIFGAWLTCLVHVVQQNSPTTSLTLLPPRFAFLGLWSLVLDIFNCDIQRGTVKVDAARKRGGTKIVWLAWFTDSIAFWRRQNEAPYLLDEPRLNSSEPNVELDQPPPVEPEAEDWNADQKDAGEGPSSSLKLGEIDWNDINDEVDAAMNESDDDEERSVRSGNVSEEEDWTDESNSMIRSVRGS